MEGDGCYIGGFSIGAVGRAVQVDGLFERWSILWSVDFVRAITAYCHLLRMAVGMYKVSAVYLANRWCIE